MSPRLRRGIACSLWESFLASLVMPLAHVAPPRYIPDKSGQAGFKATGAWGILLSYVL